MALITILLIALFWGGSFVAIQAVVQEAPPVAAAFWRVGIAIVLTFIYSYLRKLPPLNWRDRGHAMVSGILGMGIPWAALFWAEQHVNGALGAIMNATVPIAVVGLGAVLHDVRILRRQWVGIGIAFAGIVVIFGPKLLYGPSSDGLAILALVAMVAGYSTAIVYVHRFLPRVVATQVSGWQGLSALIFLGLVTRVTGESILTPTFWQVGTVWMGIAYLAIFSTFFANIAFVTLIQSKGSMMASLVTFLIPIFSMVIEWIWFGQFPTPNSFAGLILVLSGLYIVRFYKPLRFMTRPRQIDAPIP